MLFESINQLFQFMEGWKDAFDSELCPILRQSGWHGASQLAAKPPLVHFWGCCGIELAICKFDSTHDAHFELRQKQELIASCCSS